MLLFLLLSLVANSAAQFFGLTNCAFIQPMPNFQINNFTGRWYEIEHSSNTWQIYESCITIDYTFHRNNNTLDIHIQSVNSETRARQHWDGIGFVDSNNPASMVIELPPLAQAVMANYIIVETDYTNYAVAVQCSPIGLSPPTGWLMSRTADLDRRYITRGEQVLRENSVPNYTLVPNEHQNCPSN